VSTSAAPLPQIAACVPPSLIAAATLLRPAWRGGRTTLAAAALCGALAACTGAEPRAQPDDAAPPSAVEAASPRPASAETGSAALAAEPPAEPAPLGPPPRVVLRGRWTADDSAVVASELARALTRVPAAGGAVLEIDGSGRALRPTSRGIQQYAITATWTLRPAPDADVLAGSGLGEVLGVGATPDQARHGAAVNAAYSIAATLRASLPAPRSAAGTSSPSF
jgi:hypothetical protein